MTQPAVAAPGTDAHEHDLHLVEVSYDESGGSTSEYSCASCGAVWFD